MPRTARHPRPRRLAAVTVLTLASSSLTLVAAQAPATAAVDPLPVYSVETSSTAFLSELRPQFDPSLNDYMQFGHAYGSTNTTWLKTANAGATNLSRSPWHPDNPTSAVSQRGPGTTTSPTHAGGTTSDAQASIGQSTQSATAAFDPDTACVPDGTSLTDSTSTLTGADVAPYEMDGVSFDMLDQSGQVTTRQQTWMDPNTDPATATRGLVAEATAGPTEFTLFNGALTVRVLTEARLAAVADGINPATVTFTPATVELEDRDGNITYLDGTDANYYATDPAQPDLHMWIDTNVDPYNLVEAPDGTRASGTAYVLGAAYFMDLPPGDPRGPQQGLGYLTYGMMSATAEVPVGGFDCTAPGDSDGDGLNDRREAIEGSDPAEPDTDGDGLTDGDEALVHGTDPTLTDTDGDNLTDPDEILVHGTDPTNWDADDDWLADDEEILTYGTDPMVPDTDSDGLTDGEEIYDHGTDPLVADTDSDGLTDGEEVQDGTDPLLAEPVTSVPPTTPPTEPQPTPPTPTTPVPPVTPEPPSPDADGDGLSDDEEISLGTDPTRVDSDGDRLTDRDEITGRWTARYGNVPTNPLAKDTDRDGLKDRRENKKRTNPTRADTDRDGLKDKVEIKGFKNLRYQVTFKSNPLRKDTDRDGLKDKVEVKGKANKKYGKAPTNPNRKDTDRDGLKDKVEVKRGSNPAARPRRSA